MKVLDLWGNEIEEIPVHRKKEKGLFDDYDSFVEKFEVKKTTDDCYTPPEVYNIILEWIKEHVDLTGCRIVRPFYPGGDYENEDYKPNDIVIDNPPFSILSSIIKYYTENNIKYFMFAPHLTSAQNVRYGGTLLVVGANIIYENKASVATSFVSNLFGDIRIMGIPELYRRLEDINRRNKVNLPKYEYPDNVLTISKVFYCVKNGISVSIKQNETAYIAELESQKKHKKGIFGGGVSIK